MSDPLEIALASAQSGITRACSILSRAQTSIDYVRHAQAFTRQQAIAEAKAKMAQFGDLGGAALRSLILEWEQAEAQATMELCQK